MTTYKVFCRNGAMADVEFDGFTAEDFDTDGMVNEGVTLDQFMEVASRELPSNLCHHCSGKFEINDDEEIYVIVDNSTGKAILSDSSYADMDADRIAELRDTLSAANATIAELSSERDNLSLRLSAAREDVERLMAVRDNQRSVLRQQDTRIVELSSERDNLSSELSQLKDSLSGQIALRLAALADRDKFQTEANDYRAQADSFKDMSHAARVHLINGDITNAMVFLENLSGS